MTILPSFLSFRASDDFAKPVIIHTYCIIKSFEFRYKKCKIYIIYKNVVSLAVNRSHAYSQSSEARKIGFVNSVGKQSA